MKHQQDLLEAVRQSLGGTATLGAAELALRAVLQGIRRGLRQDGNVKLAGFGSFRITHRAPRRLLLPGQTTEHHLPARQVVTFHPSPVQRQEN